MNLRRKSFQLGSKCSQVDRSPTGSGVTARVALQYHKGLIQLNQSRTFKSGATGSLFTGKAVEVPECVSSVLLRKLPYRYTMTTFTTQGDKEDEMKKIGFACKYMNLFVFSSSGDELWGLQSCGGRSFWPSFLYWSVKLCAGGR